MYDKDYVIGTVIHVLKEKIIPHLSNHVAKEQAIAMISVLKNLNAHTEVNVQWLHDQTEVITQKLTELANDLETDPEIGKRVEIKQWIDRLRKQVSIVRTGDQDGAEPWYGLNQLACDLLHLLYCLPNEEVYLERLREVMRQLLNREMSRVF